MIFGTPNWLTKITWIGLVGDVFTDSTMGNHQANLSETNLGGFVCFRNLKHPYQISYRSWFQIGFSYFHPYHLVLSRILSGDDFHVVTIFLIGFKSAAPFVLGSKLPLFPYNRGWSSTQ